MRPRRFQWTIDDSLALALLSPADAEALFRLTSAHRESLQQWLPWVDTIKSVEDTQVFIRNALAQYGRGDGFQAGIVVAGAIAGVVGYHWIERRSRVTSIGYWLADPYRGCGRAAKACAALVDHAVEGLGLNRVEIRCAVDNTRSRAVPERLGFTLEGFIRDAEWVQGRFVDHAVYGMLAREWRGRAIALNPDEALSLDRGSRPTLPGSTPRP